MKRALVLCTFASAAFAQVYPGGYPGGYPGTGYPGSGGGGISLPRRSKSKSTTTKSDSQPLPNFRGRLKQIDTKTITLDLDDYRVLEFKRTDKTKFFKDGQEIKSTEFSVGDKVSVEGPRDQDGYLTAVNVYWEAAAQKTAERDKGVYDAWGDKAEKDAKEAKPSASAQPPTAKSDPGKPEAAKAAEAKPVTADAANPPSRQDGFDPGPPTLKHGKPKDDAHLHADPVPENAPVPGAAAEPAADPSSLDPSDRAGTPPPQEMAVNRPPVNLPPPDDDASLAALRRPMDPLIRKAAEAALDFTETLPDYVCQEMIARQQSTTRPADWHPLDVVTTDLVYKGGKEEYRNITVNGKKVNKSMPEIGGAWSTGEFGTILIDLFSPSTNAKFQFRRDARIAGFNSKVYDFTVERANSHWTIHFASQTYDPAYKGTVWIDPASGRILRIEMQAQNFPDEFPADQVESAVDYQYVRLGDSRQYLLPVHADILSCQRGSNYCSKNAVDFRNYHKYTGESNIQYQDVNSNVTFDDKAKEEPKQKK